MSSLALGGITKDSPGLFLPTSAQLPSVSSSELEDELDEDDDELDELDDDSE